MGQIANFTDLQILRRPKAASVSVPLGAGDSKFARLIPGVSWVSSAQSESLQEKQNRVETSNSASFLSRLAPCLTPRLFEQLEPTMLLSAVLDTGVIVSVYLFVNKLFGWCEAHWFGVRILSAYVAMFLIFATAERLYSRQSQTAAQLGSAVRALTWATLVMCFVMSAFAGHPSNLLICVFSIANVSAIMAARWSFSVISPPHDGARNVLIVGDGAVTRQIADAIHGDQRSRRIVKGFMPEHHLRNVYGASMLSRIAREEFIDEIIVTTKNPAVARIAIEGARANALDVSVAPEICVTGLTGNPAFESVGGMPLLRIHDYPHPEYGLAVKRGLDIVVSLFGLVLLAPVFLMIAASIKVDSDGPALYRAERTGRKGQRFSCYKFRTMITQADDVKDALRSSNERDGAFFKITNDPRVTRLGKLLRRYSLDELPQLWNVLRGNMSLVGPRPHPLDDVGLYELRHLQRLDFVPGITGLWQVTARRDPSFERSVALDVEYIKKWNLWLDARILWRTISAVLQGSGA